MSVNRSQCKLMCFHRFEQGCNSDICSVSESFMKEKNVEHSQWEWLSPLPHMFCCNFPRVPKRPRRSVEEEELNEILMKLTLDFTFTLRKVVSKNVMKLTAVLAGTFLVLFLRTQSANWGAPAILSRIAPPRSDLSLRVSCKNKLTKLRKCASRVREDTPPLEQC